MRRVPLIAASLALLLTLTACDSAAFDRAWSNCIRSLVTVTGASSSATLDEGVAKLEAVREYCESVSTNDRAAFIEAWDAGS